MFIHKKDSITLSITHVRLAFLSTWHFAIQSPAGTASGGCV
jgi:hypothetical protein